MEFFEFEDEECHDGENAERDVKSRCLEDGSFKTMRKEDGFADRDDRRGDQADDGGFETSHATADDAIGFELVKNARDD